ncbi:hypothetical protein [Dactylosporangium darangshiense]|uniref:Alpha/beta hydrolase n=1 Tax=Dactylosporangium darangshiense TaxID=579108 RepID=A0ABP8DUS5_9ACTN
MSEHGNAIPAHAQQFMAKRMGATTETISGFHLAFMAQPVAVANFIKKALV